MGPLESLTIIELAGMGPGPFAAMLLADLGARVIKVDRTDADSQFGLGEKPFELLNRGRQSIALDLKTEAGRSVMFAMAADADALIEGFRPGVMERLGLGPDEMLAQNPRLVYGRMTGWGQDGPYSAAAGHDLNYIALSGALEPIGELGGPPIIPINLVGDFGGGGMLLAFGVLAGIVEVSRSGQGQVVDAAIVDGAALLSTSIHMINAWGRWSHERGSNMFGGAAPFYSVYECSDGRYISLAPCEPHFYRQLLERLDLAQDDLPEQYDESQWAAMKQRIADRVRTRSQAEWCALLDGTDVCFAPVLAPFDAPRHTHNQQRQTFIEVAGVVQPAPAPRFSRTPGEVSRPPARPGENTVDILTQFGFGRDRIDELLASGSVVQAAAPD